MVLLEKAEHRQHFFDFQTANEEYYEYAILNILLSDSQEKFLLTNH